MIQIDIPMPKVCGECPFMDDQHHELPFCTVLKKDRGYPVLIHKVKFPNCPLKPVVEEKEDESEIERLKHDRYTLQNRCLALTKASMCVFCGMKNDCKPLADAAARYEELQEKEETHDE